MKPWRTNERAQGVGTAHTCALILVYTQREKLASYRFCAIAWANIVIAANARISAELRENITALSPDHPNPPETYIVGGKQ